jgi:serine/threonine protein kinase
LLLAGMQPMSTDSRFWANETVLGEPQSNAEGPRHEGRIDPLPPHAGKVIGDYELLEELGRGGMGVVYKARQRKLKRVVALKMIRADRFASGDEVERFFAEAQTVALLDHPGIVSVHEVGQDCDQRFYSMVYVDGPTLQAVVRDGGILAAPVAAAGGRRHGLRTPTRRH